MIWTFVQEVGDPGESPHSVQFFRKTSSWLNTWVNTPINKSFWYILLSFIFPQKIFRNSLLQRCSVKKICSLLQTEPSSMPQCHTKHCTAPAPWNSKYSLYLAFRDLIQDRTQMTRLRSLKSSAHYTFGLPNFHSSTNPLGTTETRFYFCLEDTMPPCSSSRLRPEIPCFPCSFPSSKMKK